jgi:DNA-binding transcriptional ArsR family regulator
MSGVSSRPHDPSPAPPLEEVESVFLALSHEARRHVLLLLSQLGGELPSGYLATRFQHSWPTTTRHLKVLEEAGLVEVRREGRGSHYRLNRERLRRVVGGWLRHVDPVGPEKKWTSPGPKSTDALAAAAESRTTQTTRSRKKQAGLKGER